MTATLTAGALPATEPLLIDVTEAARHCGCSTRHVRPLANEGGLPVRVELGPFGRAGEPALCA
jgi:hypothetical protein